MCEIAIKVSTKYIIGELLQSKLQLSLAITLFSFQNKGIFKGQKSTAVDRMILLTRMQRLIEVVRKGGQQ